MKQYILAQVIRLVSGNVLLTKAQYARRTHSVSKPDKDGISQILQPIMFKAHEEFGYDGEIPKSYLPIEPTVEDADPDTPPEEPAEDLIEEPAEGSDARFDAIVAAIQELDPDNQDQFTQNGKPDATVLTEHLGWRVSATERDEAWEAIQES